MLDKALSFVLIESNSGFSSKYSAVYKLIYCYDFRNFIRYLKLIVDHIASCEFPKFINYDLGNARLLRDSHKKHGMIRIHAYTL